MKIANVFALTLCSFMLLTACTNQHYQVMKVKPLRLHKAKIEVKALSGRLNGYSVQIKNENELPIKVDWGHIQIKQEDGYEVPTKVKIEGTVSKIHPQNQVKYHIEPAHHYQVKERQGQLDRMIYWDDQFKLWPNNKQTLYIPYSLTETGSEKEVTSEFILEISQQARRAYNEEQETFDWMGDTYDTPPKSRGLTLKLRGGISDLSLYHQNVLGSFGFEVGYQVDAFELSLGYRGLSEVEQNNISQDSSETSLFLTYDVFDFWLITTKVFGQLNYLRTRVTLEDPAVVRSTALVAWDQGNLMAGGGVDLGLHLGESLSFGVKAGMSSGLYLSIEDDPLERLQSVRIFQLNSHFSQFDVYLRYQF